MVLDIFLTFLFSGLIWSGIGVITDSEKNFDRRYDLPFYKFIIACCIRYSPMTVILTFLGILIWVCIDEVFSWVYKIMFKRFFDWLYERN